MFSTRIEHGDALEKMGTLASGSIDCIVTDPPYQSLDKWRGMGTTTRLGGGLNGESDPDKFFQTVDFEYLIECIREFDRLLPKNGHAWVMCDGETVPYILNYVRETDETAFSPCKKGYSKLYPVLKKAQSGGYRQGMGYHGRGSHEYVILLEKGRRRFTDENFPDVFEAVWSGDAETRPFTPDGKPYPTAKPVALFRRWIELSTTAGERVLDPFAGGGTCGTACLQTGRQAILFDASARSIQTLQRRLVQPVMEAFADGDTITNAQMQTLLFQLEAPHA